MLIAFADSGYCVSGFWFSWCCLVDSFVGCGADLFFRGWLFLAIGVCLWVWLACVFLTLF